jgi:hypothetical protein
MSHSQSRHKFGLYWHLHGLILETSIRDPQDQRGILKFFHILFHWSCRGFIVGVHTAVWLEAK